MIVGITVSLNVFSATIDPNTFSEISNEKSEIANIGFPTEAFIPKKLMLYILSLLHPHGLQIVPHRCRARQHVFHPVCCLCLLPQHFSHMPVRMTTMTVAHEA